METGGCARCRMTQPAIHGVDKVFSMFTPNRTASRWTEQNIRTGNPLRLKTPIRKQDGGFTLVELMVVMLIIGVLAAVAIPNFVAAIKGAKEAALKEDLHVIRDAIDSYTMDKNKAPQSLDDLVQNGYLKSIPEDPFTHSRETWVPASDD